MLSSCYISKTIMRWKYPNRNRFHQISMQERKMSYILQFAIEKYLRVLSYVNIMPMRAFISNKNSYILIKCLNQSIFNRLWVLVFQHRIVEHTKSYNSSGSTEDAQQPGCHGKGMKRVLGNEQSLNLCSLRFK